MTVLALRALGLGDLLTAVPALRALRRAFPGHRIALAAPAWLAGAAAASGAVDTLVPCEGPGRTVPRRIPWAGPPPEVAVDLHGCDAVSAQPLRGLHPGRLLGYSAPSGPVWRSGEHERDRWCRLLTWYGIPADAADYRLPAPGVPSPFPGAVVVHPGADAAARRWPPARFAAVVRALHGAGHRVVLTGGAGEADLTARVATLARLPATPVLRELPFRTLAALVSQARALVCGDTGPAHLATALGTPSVVLFGPVPPSRWGPPPLPRHRVLWHPAAPTRADPHATGPDPRLLAIATDEVLAALDSVLAPAPVRPA